MGRKCSVFNCRTNYDPLGPDQQKISVYRFPLEDKIALEAWVRNLPNKIATHEITKHMGVCGLHWPADAPMVKKRQVPCSSCSSVCFPGVPESCVPSSVGTTPRPTRKALAASRSVDIDEMEQFRANDKFIKDTFLDQLKTKVNDSAFVNASGEEIIIFSKSRDGPIHNFSIYLSPQLLNNSDVATFHYEAYYKLKKICHPDIKLLSCWSQLDELILSLKNYEFKASDKKLDFLTHSVSLFNSPKNKRVYSVEDFSLAFDWFSKSRSLYKDLREYFRLPSDSTLRKITSMATNVDDTTLFKSIFGKLDERSKGCVLIIDEIYIKASLTYRGGSIFGRAVDNPNKIATTILCVMAKCFFGSKRFLVRLIPVNALTSAFQFDVVKNVIVQLESCGAFVVGLINDNNRVNQSFFKMFDKFDLAKPWLAKSPVDHSRALFLLYDTVHLIKNIRNSWITEKTQTINYPVEDGVKSAYWSDLIQLYDNDIEVENSCLRLSNLTRSSVYPNNIEKQKMSLALNVFCDRTSSALKTSSKRSHTSSGTALFVDMVIRLWKVFNAKTTFLHIHCRDQARAVVDLSENGQSQLNTLKEWSLLASKMEPTTSERFKTLTKDTAKALQWTCNCLVDLCQFLLTSTGPLHHNYVAVGFFQQDDIEHHFAHFRMSAGCNYYISAEQVAHTHAIDRAKLMLQFETADIDYERSRHECSCCTHDLSDNELLLLDDMMPTLIDSLKADEKKSLFHIGGYIIKKHQELGSLAVSLDEGVSNSYEDMSAFTSALDRGGLKYPSIDLVNLLACCYIFITKSDVESCKKRFIRILEDFPNLFHIPISVDRSVLSTIINIVLKNWCTKVSSFGSISSSGNKKRKIDKLSSR